MVMTILEGDVESTNWNKLTEDFRAASSKKPKQIVETFLTQSKDNPNNWRGISIWHSKESLDEYRKNVEVPGEIGTRAHDIRYSRAFKYIGVDGLWTFSGTFVQIQPMGLSQSCLLKLRG
jgi:hypothetical protein